MTLERIPNHVERGTDLLLDQYKGKPRIAAMLKSWLRQVQMLEDAIYDVLLSRLIDNAVGPRLDTIGRFVGEPRKGRDDTTYRRFIRARIRINRSEGTAKDIFDVLGLITSTPGIFNEYQPAAMYLEMLEIPDQDPVSLYSLLFDTKAAGAKLSLVVPTSATSDRFLPRSYDAADVAGRGCGDANVAASYGLLSDAVTVRDPAAAPALPRPVAPVVLFIEPNVGPDAGGTALTFHGRGFATSTEVPPVVRLHSLGADASNVDDVVVVSDALITCTTRARDESQPRKLAAWVKTPYGTSSRTAAFRYVAPPVLAILSVAPSSGVLGTVVVIRGSKLTDALEVGVEVYGDYTPMSSFTVDSDTQITAVMPMGASLFAPYGVRVRLAAEQFLFRGDGAFPPAFRFLPPPTCAVDDVAQEGTSIMGGYAIHLTGTLLNELIDISYDFLSSIGAGTLIDNEHIDFVAPDADSVFHDLSDGAPLNVDVGIYSTGGPPVGSFQVHYDPLSVAAVAPSETPGIGGELITLSGTSLDATEPYDAMGPTSGLFVDGVETDFTVVDEHTITFVAPAGTSGTTVSIALVGIVGANSGVPVGTATAALIYS